MTVVFHDALLRRAAEEPDFCPAEWSADTLRVYRRRLQRLDAIHDEQDLFAVRSLGVQRVEGGALEIRLDDRIVVSLRVAAANGAGVRVVLDGFAVLRRERSA